MQTYARGQSLTMVRSSSGLLCPSGYISTWCSLSCFTHSRRIGGRAPSCSERLRARLLTRVSNRFLVLLSNTLYFVAFAHATYISFLGYNSLPSLARTQLLLAPPLAIGALFWLLATIAGWSATTHLAPILWTGGGLRKALG